jgi:glycerol-3-phosphate O-acyltransferase
MQKYNIKVVPISLMYDRIFDSGLFAKEILSGKFEDMNVFELLKTVYKMPAGKIGKIFVKYHDPIDINQYVRERQAQ